MNNILNTSSGVVTLISRTNDGTNVLTINGTTLNVSDWVGTGNYTFTEGGQTFTIKQISENTGNIILKIIDDYNYEMVKIFKQAEDLAELAQQVADLSGTVTEIQNPEFDEAETRVNILSGDSLSTLFGKIRKFFADLKSIAFSGSYDDLLDVPDFSETYVAKSGDTITGTLNARTILPSTDLGYSLGSGSATWNYTYTRYLRPKTNGSGSVGSSNYHYGNGYINNVYTTGGAIADGNGKAVNGDQVYDYLNTFGNFKQIFTDGHDYTNTVSVPYNTVKNLSSLQFTKGTYLVICSAQISPAGACEETLWLSSSSSGAVANAKPFETTQLIKPSSSYWSTLTFMTILHATSTVTKYLNCSHNSSTTLTGIGNIKALRLGD